MLSCIIFGAGSELQNDRNFVIENHSFQGFFLQFFCIFNRKFRRKWHLCCNSLRVVVRPHIPAAAVVDPRHEFHACRLDYLKLQNINGRFSIENHRFSGAILHYLCISIENSKIFWHLYCNSYALHITPELRSVRLIIPVCCNQLSLSEKLTSAEIKLCWGLRVCTYRSPSRSRSQWRRSPSARPETRQQRPPSAPKRPG